MVLYLDGTQKMIKDDELETDAVLMQLWWRNPTEVCLPSDDYDKDDGNTNNYSYIFV